MRLNAHRAWRSIIPRVLGCLVRIGVGVIKLIGVVIGVLLLALVGVSIAVELEADETRQSLGPPGRAKALVLFHPSRDARFSDDLSLAFAQGLQAGGMSVDRATLTRHAPASAQGYALVAVVSNTYYWTPDLPTLRYLGRARLDGVAAVGLIGGAGATRRSQRLLAEALRSTGARVMQTRSFWLFRPNDESRMNEPNRAVALDIAQRWGTETAQAVLAK